MTKAKITKKKVEATTPEPDSEIETLLCGNTVKVERIEWAWRGMLVRHAVNLVDGYKGVGKSTLLASMASAICRGRPLPGERKSKPAGRCLWIGSEESFAAAVLPRWVANEGRKEDILSLNSGATEGAGRLVLPDQSERLVALVRHYKIGVVVLDPYSACLSSAVDTRHEQQTRYYLESFARIAAEQRVTVLITRHFRKGNSGTALEQGLGSVAIVNVCRSVLRADRDQDNPSTCWLSCVSCNHGAAPGAIPYTLEPSTGDVFKLVFGTRKDRTIEDIRNGAEAAQDRDESADAKKLLTASLASGPVEAKTLLDEARRAGIGERTLRKAKAELRVISIRQSQGKGTPGTWKWKMPANPKGS